MPREATGVGQPTLLVGGLTVGLVPEGLGGRFWDDVWVIRVW